MATDDEPRTLRELTDQFTGSTSAHGISHVSHNRRALANTFWVVIFTAGMIALTLHIRRQVTRYYDYPLQVKIQVKTAEALPFPAITVCNLCPVQRDLIRCSRLRSLVELDMSPTPQMQKKLLSGAFVIDGGDEATMNIMGGGFMAAECDNAEAAWYPPTQATTDATDGDLSSMASGATTISAGSSSGSSVGGSPQTGGTTGLSSSVTVGGSSAAATTSGGATTASQQPTGTSAAQTPGVSTTAGGGSSSQASTTSAGQQTTGGGATSAGTGSTNAGTTQSQTASAGGASTSTTATPVSSTAAGTTSNSGVATNSGATSTSSPNTSGASSSTPTTSTTQAAASTSAGTTQTATSSSQPSSTASGSTTRATTTTATGSSSSAPSTTSTATTVAASTSAAQTTGTTTQSATTSSLQPSTTTVAGSTGTTTTTGSGSTTTAAGSTSAAQTTTTGATTSPTAATSTTTTPQSTAASSTSSTSAGATTASSTDSADSSTTAPPTTTSTSASASSTTRATTTGAAATSTTPTSSTTAATTPTTTSTSAAPPPTSTVAASTTGPSSSSSSSTTTAATTAQSSSGAASSATQTATATATTASAAARRRRRKRQVAPPLPPPIDTNLTSAASNDFLAMTNWGETDSGNYAYYDNYYNGDYDYEGYDNGWYDNYDGSGAYVPDEGDWMDDMTAASFQNESNIYKVLLQMSQTDDLSDLSDLVLFNETEFDMYGYQADDFILQCSFDRTACHPANFSQFYNSRYGNCYTFNSALNGSADGGRVRMTRKYGSEYGLRLTLNINASQFVGLLASEYGVRVAINDNKDPSYPQMDGFNAATGMYTAIGLLRQEVNRLPSPYESKCRKEYPTALQALAGSSAQYGLRECQLACIDYHLLKECNCADLDRSISAVANDKSLVEQLLSGKGVASKCNPFNKAQRNCRKTVLTRLALSEGSERALRCDCRPPCSEVNYRRTISQSVWPSTQTGFMRVNHMYGADPMATMIGDQHSLAGAVDFATRNLVRLQFYYQELNYESIVEEAGYPVENLLADLGGIIGLYVGLSLCAIFELIFFIFSILAFVARALARGARPAGGRVASAVRKFSVANTPPVPH